MHAKYALALVLVLQVSLSLCEIPPPSQELVDKYNILKAKFFKRVSGAYEKVEAEAVQLEFLMAVKEYLKSMESYPELQAAKQVAEAFVTEVEPLVETTRLKLLGLYEHYLRAYIGQSLDGAINNVQPVLDMVIPAQ